MIRFLDSFIDSMGRAVAWLCLAMALAMFISVALSYFQINAIAFQESIVWMHGFVFLLGAAYTLQKDEHVRVDIFYQRFTDRQRAWVNLLGTLVLLVPVMIFIIWMSYSFVANSWQICEASSEAGGLPGRFLFRTLIILMAVFMLVQALSVALRNAWTLLGRSELVPSVKQRQLDLSAQLILAFLLLAFLIFAVVWFFSHCQNTSAGDLSQYPLWTYMLLLVPYLCVLLSVLHDLLKTIKRHAQGDSLTNNNNNHSGV